MAKVKCKLKNNFNKKKYNIQIQYDVNTAKPGETIPFNLDTKGEYKPITITKNKGEWPEEMYIDWCKGICESISIKLPFKSGALIQEEKNDFELQIKLTQKRYSIFRLFGGAGTTVTIGDAPPCELPSPCDKKKE